MRLDVVPATPDKEGEDVRVTNNELGTGSKAACLAFGPLALALEPELEEEEVGTVFGFCCVSSDAASSSSKLAMSYK